MSMPTIPEEKFRPSIIEVTIDMIKTVAMEETAISHILNAEGERCQELLRRYCCCCCKSITTAELNESIRLTERIISDSIMKEWLLLKQLETVSDLNKLLTLEQQAENAGLSCKEHGCEQAPMGAISGCEGAPISCPSQDELDCPSVSSCECSTPFIECCPHGFCCKCRHFLSCIRGRKH